MSSVADILITVSLFGLLQTSRTDAERYPPILLFNSLTGEKFSRSINAIIDSLILYTFETGSLTWCAVNISFPKTNLRGN